MVEKFLISTWNEIPIEEEEISLLESYFCKPGEFYVTKLHNTKGSTDYLLRLTSEVKNSNAPCIIEMQLCLICNDGCYCVTSNPLHISFNQLKGNANKKHLEVFKDSVLAHKELLLQSEEFSLFSFVTWISNEIQNLDLVHEDDTVNSSKEPSTCLHGTLMKLDHIRSTSRYYKFLKETSSQLCVNIKLIRCGKLIYMLVFGSDVSMKEYIKKHKTSLVDVDSNGKPCKERMLQIKLSKVIDINIVQKYNLVTAGFHVIEIDDFNELEKQLESFSFSRADM